MSLPWGFFCPHDFRKLLIFNDLWRAARRKPLIVSHLRQMKKLHFFLVLFNFQCYCILMNETVKILMSRDGLSKDEAVKQVVDFFKAMKADIEQGGDPFGWENDFVSEFGLGQIFLKISFLGLQFNKN